MAISQASVHSADATGRTNLIRQGYGGSDRTDSSFTRPQFNRYNSIAKSRDFGAIDNLAAAISGTIGGATGSQTLFFKVETSGPAQLRISRAIGNARESQYISVGICGADRKPLPLGADGSASGSDLVATSADESANPLMPAGIYYFTVSSSQWQALPYAAELEVLRYRQLEGAAGGVMELVGRFSMRQLAGSLIGSADPQGTLQVRADVKALAGLTEGGDASFGALAIMRGSAGGELQLIGRLRLNWKLAGSAGGELSATGTLSRTGAGGYG